MPCEPGIVPLLLTEFESKASVLRNANDMVAAERNEDGNTEVIFREANNCTVIETPEQIFKLIQEARKLSL